MTLRQLRVLVEQLPPSSALGRAIRGHNWLDEHYIAADTFDMLHRLFSWQIAAHSEKGKYQEPKPFPRPGVVDLEDEHKAKSTANAIAYIEAYRARREEGA